MALPERPGKQEAVERGQLVRPFAPGDFAPTTCPRSNRVRAFSELTAGSAPLEDILCVNLPIILLFLRGVRS